MSQSPFELWCTARGFRAQSIPAERPKRPMWPKDATHWVVTITGPGGEMITTPYSMGSAHKGPPKAAGVLACLLSDASAGEQSFEGFCSSLACNPDSRAAFADWETCVDVASRLRAFLGPLWDEAQDRSQDH